MEYYIVLSQVRVIGLNAVIQNGDDNPFARVAFPPGRNDVHVETFLTTSVLSSRKQTNNKQQTKDYQS